MAQPYGRCEDCGERLYATSRRVPVSELWAAVRGGRPRDPDGLSVGADPPSSRPRSRTRGRTRRAGGPRRPHLGGDGHVGGAESVVRRQIGPARRPWRDRRRRLEARLTAIGAGAAASSRHESDDLTAMSVSESTACEGSQAVNGGGLKIRSRRSSWVRSPPLALTTVRGKTERLALANFCCRSERDQPLARRFAR